MVTSTQVLVYFPLKLCKDGIMAEGEVNGRVCSTSWVVVCWNFDVK